MSTQPVRVSLEVTWWPGDDTWSIARRAWRRDHNDQWALEEMATSGTPLTRDELLRKLDEASTHLAHEVIESASPFGDAGPFVS